MLLKGITEVQAATRPAAAAEMVLVRIAYVADLPTPDEAIRMLEQGGGASPVLGSAVPSSAPAVPSSSMQSPTPRVSSAPRASAEASPRPQISEPMAGAQSAPVLKLNSFAEIVALAAERRDLSTKAALEADVRLVRIEDGRLEVALERSAARMLINDLSRKLEQWTGRRWTVIVSNEPGQPTLRSQNELQKNQRERAAESDPRVKEVLARFPGAKVVEVRKLAAEMPESDASADDPAEMPDSDDQ
jgi:DNA polymerase-3 subunit gamma/tau